MEVSSIEGVEGFLEDVKNIKLFDTVDQAFNFIKNLSKSTIDKLLNLIDRAIDANIVPKDLKNRLKKTKANILAAIEKAAAAAKEAAEKAAAAAKTIGLAPGRGAFLLLVQFNVRGFATRLAKIDQQKLRDKWNQLGGNITELNKAIELGKNKKAVLGTKGEKINGIGEPVTITTAIVAAAPVIVAIVALLKELSPGAVDEELNGITTEAEQAWSNMYGGDMSGFDFALQRGKESGSANDNFNNDPGGNTGGGGTNTNTGTNTGGVNFGELLKKYWWIPAGLVAAKVAKVI